jgi:hypothetical protein
MMDETFSVCQFFINGGYEYYRRNVSADEAVKAARFLTTNVAARIGTTVRVIITDSGDCTAWEWKHGEGITFPPSAASG